MCIVGRVFQQPLQCFFLGSCLCNSVIGATGPQNIRFIPACLVVCSLFCCFIQNNFSLLAIITRIVAADDVSGMVISLLLIGFGNELDISPEFFLVTFTMRGDPMATALILFTKSPPELISKMVLQPGVEP